MLHCPKDFWAGLLVNLPGAKFAAVKNHTVRGNFENHMQYFIPMLRHLTDLQGKDGLKLFCFPLGEFIRAKKYFRLSASLITSANAMSTKEKVEATNVFAYSGKHLGWVIEKGGCCTH